MFFKTRGLLTLASLATLGLIIFIACGDGGAKPDSSVSTTVITEGTQVSSEAKPSPAPSITRPVVRAKTSVGSMNDPRQGFGTVVLEDGKLLAIGGIGPYGPFPLVESYDPGLDTWTTRARMMTSRSFFVTAKLNDGRILVAGGLGETENLESAEIYDPVTDTWSQIRRMVDSRALAAGVTLDDGRVMVTGGNGFKGGAQKTVEAYDPIERVWLDLAEMHDFRVSHTATKLLDGRVIVVGGSDGVGEPRESAEIYDPLTGEWSVAPKLEFARVGHTATLLNDGRVLVVGGDESTPAAEVYDPETNSWRLTPQPFGVRVDHTSVLMPDGTVLVVAGGPKGLADDSVEIYHPAEDKWLQAGNIDEARVSHSSVLLNDGRVMVFGGAEKGPFDSVEFYNPKSGAWFSDPFLGNWERAGTLVQGRAGHSSTLLRDGTILVVGGRGRSGDPSSPVEFTASAELYDPVTGESKLVDAMNIERGGHIATRLKDGRVLVVGGRKITLDDEGKRALRNENSAEIYDPESGTWTLTTPMPRPLWGHTALSLDDGSVLVVGGEIEAARSTASVEIFDPVKEEWTPTASMFDVRAGHSMLRLPNGNMLVAGGSGPTVAVFDVNTRQWSQLPNLDQRLQKVTVGVFEDGAILVAGGFGAQGASNAALLYEPGAPRWVYADRMPEVRTGATATQLSGGRLLLLGGSGTTKAWLFDRALSGWLYAGKMFTERTDHTSTLLPDGRVVVIGGEGRLRNISGGVDIYRPDGVN